VKEKKKISEFTQALARDGINVVLRENSKGDIYGITCCLTGNTCIPLFESSGLIFRFGGLTGTQEGF